MRQPELGQKLSELRKAKGLTQEELVEKCNISVRTIQRIETGEVNPRSYTLRTILSALGAHPEELRPKSEKTVKGPKKFVIAWFSGLVYLLLGPIEGTLEFSRFVGETQIPGFNLLDFIEVVEFSPETYLTVKIFVLLTFLPFMWGLVKLGDRLGRSLVSVMGKILMVLMTFIIGFDIISFFFFETTHWFFQLLIALILGIVSIVFGVSLIQLKNQLGIIALLAGVFEIISGLFFLMASPVGLFIQMIATLFEIILLYQFAKRQDVATS